MELGAARHPSIPREPAAELAGGRVECSGSTGPMAAKQRLPRQSWTALDASRPGESGPSTGSGIANGGIGKVFHNLYLFGNFVTLRR